MKLRLRDSAGPPIAFVEAWGEPRPRRMFRYEKLATNLIQCGPPVAMEQDSRSRQHLPLPNQPPEHGVQGQKPIQSP
jgi:hypothetical protein